MRTHPSPSSAMATELHRAESPFHHVIGWFVRHPRVTLALLVLAALVPFLNKPFNMDDPLFLWAARHIQSHPADPYGFGVNWYGTVEPMWQVTKNPPLTSYWLALWAAIFGWSEPALHAAMLLPALMVILGTHRLAGHFCKRPLLAAAAALFTPVFLVSSTTLMCDVMMLAFWVWAVVFWIEGIQNGRQRLLACAAVLIACAALTKYFGICLIPLLFVWALIGKHPLRRWVGWLLVPALVLAGYHLWTQSLYGVGLLRDAGVYAASIRDAGSYSTLTNVITTLAFMGGCAAVVVFFAPLLWRWTGLAVGAGCMGLIFYPLKAAFNRVGSFEATSASLLAGQMAFWFVAGLGVLSLAVSEVRRRRDAVAWLLALWVLGTFVFTGFFNWIINARSILPIVPAVGLLIVRRLDHRLAARSAIGNVRVVVPLTLSAILAMWVACADFRLATAVRETARQIHVNHGNGGTRLWFQGHWGFQYYMEACGAHAVDVEQPVFQPGDRLITPLNNTNIRPMKEAMREGFVTELDAVRVPGPDWLTTMNLAVGAGFHASLWGPLPFALGLVPPEGADVGVLTR